jgi:hypothetical protein
MEGKPFKINENLSRELLGARGSFSQDIYKKLQIR